jgi:hypothetical protein
MSIKFKDLILNKNYLVRSELARYHTRFDNYAGEVSIRTHIFNIIRDGKEDGTYFMISDDGLEDTEEIKELEEKEVPEPDTYKPEHYYKNSFKVSDVQEEIGYNVFKALGSDDKAYKSSVWVTYALKHLCRAGNKDDVKLELKKAINYLTKALEGEFINEKN